MKRLPILVLLFIGLSTILAGLILPSGMRETRCGVEERVVTARPVCINACEGAPVCVGKGANVRIVDLVRDGNRYDRRLVIVEGESILLRHRRSHCGDYVYFVLKDREGYHVSVTDYTANRRFLEEKRVTVTGYYRAHLHEIDVCSEVNL